MSKTRQQLVNRSIKELGIIPLSTESYASINELIDGMVESLQDRGVLDDVFDVANIDERMFLPLAHCLAYYSAPEMGTDENLYPRLAGQCQKAEQDLRVMQASAPTYKPLKVDYF